MNVCMPVYIRSLITEDTQETQTRYQADTVIPATIDILNWPAQFGIDFV